MLMEASFLLKEKPSHPSESLAILSLRVSTGVRAKQLHPTMHVVGGSDCIEIVGQTSVLVASVLVM